MENTPSIAPGQEGPNQLELDGKKSGFSEIIQAEPTDTSVCLEWIIERIQRSGPAE